MKRPGMTLPEMLMSLTIIAIVAVVSTAAYVATVRFAHQEQLSSKITLGAGRVLGPLDELLGQGVAVLSQYPTTGAATVTSGTNALVVSIPALDSNGDATVTAYDIVTIALDTAISGNTRLIATVHPDTTIPSTRPAETIVIATNVLDLYVRYPTTTITNATSVGLTVRLQKTERGNTSRQTFALNSTLRNHP